MLPLFLVIFGWTKRCLSKCLFHLAFTFHLLIKAVIKKYLYFIHAAFLDILPINRFVYKTNIFKKPIKTFSTKSNSFIWHVVQNPNKSISCPTRLAAALRAGEGCWWCCWWCHVGGHSGVRLHGRLRPLEGNVLTLSDGGRLSGTLVSSAFNLVF